MYCGKKWLVAFLAAITFIVIIAANVEAADYTDVGTISSVTDLTIWAGMDDNGGAGNLYLRRNDGAAGVYDSYIELTPSAINMGGEIVTINNGLVVTGGLNNNTGGITNAGAISGVTTLGTSGLATLNSANVSTTLGVTGATTLTGSLTANGGITADGGVFTVADTTGDVATSGTLTAAGLTTLNGGITADGGVFTVADTTGDVATSGTLTAAGLTTLNGGITADGGVFTVADTTGNVATSGTLGVAGLSTLSGGISADNFTVADTTGNLTALGATNTIGTAGSSANTLTGATNTITGATTITSTGTANQMIVDGTSSRLVSASGTQSVAVNNSGTTITGAAGHTLNVTSTTTTVNGTATVYSGNGAGNSMVVDGTSSRFVSSDTFSTATVMDDSVRLVADDDGLGTNARSALTMSPAYASLLVNTDSGAMHGIYVGQSSTVISGGTDTTTLTLNDDGATFADDDTGAPVKVTGVADGVGDYDAVNMRQYRKLEDRIDTAYSGIASVAAIAAIPAPVPGKNISLGLGYGNFESENAVAVGGKAIVGKEGNTTLTAGVGFCGSTTTISAGVGWSF